MRSESVEPVEEEIEGEFELELVVTSGADTGLVVVGGAGSDLHQVGVGA